MTKKYAVVTFEVNIENMDAPDLHTPEGEEWLNGKTKSFQMAGGDGNVESGIKDGGKIFWVKLKMPFEGGKAEQMMFRSVISLALRKMDKDTRDRTKATVEFIEEFRETSTDYVPDGYIKDGESKSS